MAKTQAERAKEYRERKRDAVTVDNVTPVTKPGSVTGRDGCPNDWLDRINSLPDRVARPLFGVTGELRDRTYQQLQSSMPQVCWQSSQEYAEVIYRLLYQGQSQLEQDRPWLPSWWRVDSRDYVGVAV
jgi:hypothetical protein